MKRKLLEPYWGPSGHDDVGEQAQRIRNGLHFMLVLGLVI
jgi:hypothetical protein